MRSHLISVQDWRVLANTAHYHPQKLAALCHVSLRHLERYFSDEMSCSPQMWLHDVRLKEAARLLLEGHHVKEVAFELGFAHPSHFIREFRRAYNCTPLDFVISAHRKGANHGARPDP